MYSLSLALRFGLVRGCHLVCIYPSSFIYPLYIILLVICAMFLFFYAADIVLGAVCCLLTDLHHHHHHHHRIVVGRRRRFFLDLSFRRRHHILTAAAIGAGAVCVSAEGSCQRLTSPSPIDILFTSHSSLVCSLAPLPR